MGVGAAPGLGATPANDTLIGSGIGCTVYAPGLVVIVAAPFLETALRWPVFASGGFLSNRLRPRWPLCRAIVTAIHLLAEVGHVCPRKIPDQRS
jgi:hypothetical protein